MRNRTVPKPASGWRPLFPVAIAAIAVMLAGCDPSPAVSIAGPDNSVRATVKVEIANTPAERELGLMYRNHLDENAAMLFIFAKPAPEQFWMRNTEIPLDMIFADASGRVSAVVANEEPFSEKLVGPSSASKYVVEVNGGFAARHGIKPGDRLRFRGFRPKASD